MTNVDVKIRSNDTCIPNPYALWDTEWRQDIDGQPFGGFGDWAIAGDAQAEPYNQGGLKAQKALATAILIQLFTDKRVSDDIEPPDGSGDRRGWVGDGFDVRSDLDEREMGSHLWLLERSPLYSETTQLLARQYCEEALEVFIQQGVVARFKIEIDVDSNQGSMLINVSAYSKTNTAIYEQRFSRVWEQIK